MRSKRRSGGTLTQLSNVVNTHTELKKTIDNAGKYDIKLNMDDDIGNAVMIIQSDRYRFIKEHPSNTEKISMYDKLLYYLIIAHRATNSTVNTSTPTFCCIPWHDCLVSDMQEQDYNLISDVFGIKHLSKAVEGHVFPIKGIFHGIQERLVCPLIISRGNYRIWVICLIDTGSAITSLTEDTYYMLVAPGTNYSSKVRVNIHGLTNFPCSVSTLTDDRVGNVNLVGQDFLKKYGMKLTIDYNIPSYTVGAFTMDCAKDMTAGSNGRSIRKKSHKPKHS
jgi:hypothetical protein